MKKFLLTVLAAAFLLAGYGQGVKISQMPIYVPSSPASMSGVLVPVVVNVNGTYFNRTMSPDNVGYNKVENITTTQGPVYDTNHIWKNGAKVGYFLTRAVGSVESPDTIKLSRGLYYREDTLFMDPWALQAGQVVNDQDYTDVYYNNAVLFSRLTAARTVTLLPVSGNEGHELTITNGGNGAFNINLSSPVRVNLVSTVSTVASGATLKVKIIGGEYWKQ